MDHQASMTSLKLSLEIGSMVQMKVNMTKMINIGLIKSIMKIEFYCNPEICLFYLNKTIKFH